MSGDTIIFVGCGIGDDIFTTHPDVLGKPVVWNVTRLRKAANSGWFGLAESFPVDILPPIASLPEGAVTWGKVTGMIDSCAKGGVITGVLNEPAIVVCVNHKGREHRIPVDGNHRICARRVLGLSTWPAFLVSPELETKFRVLELVR